MALARTIARAVEDASKCGPDVGYRFVPETGVPGFGMHGTVESSEASFSYAALERASARYGGALQALGLKKGDRVALILPSNEDFVLCFLGAVRAGMIPVPIYPPLGLGQLQRYLDNTRHIVDRAGARALITDARIKRLLGTVQASCSALEQVIAVEGLRESREALRIELADPSDVALLQFTSGSTSRPKGVTISHENLVANIGALMSKIGCTSEDVGVSWLPLYHDMGLIGFMLAPLFYKIKSVFLPPLLFLKRPATWLQAISRHAGTVSYAPNFAYALAVKRIKNRDLVGVDLSSWRVAGCGAEPIRAETLQAFADEFASVGFRSSAILPSYGMAESTLAVTFGELGEGLSTLSVDSAALWEDGRANVVDRSASGALGIVSCGRAFPGHSIQIFEHDDDASDSPLLEGQVGEIRISGPSVMKGYWDDIETTKSAFAGAFLRTGDLGFLQDGKLYICGRLKEVIMINGRNYYPQDMEWEASKVPGVRRGNVIAFGAMDRTSIETDRERIVLVVESEEPSALRDTSRLFTMTQTVRKAVQEGLGVTLDDVVCVAPGVLPKTSSGKLQRAKARDLYETGMLDGRADTRIADPLELVKETARSQLSYFKLAVLGGRKPVE